MGVSYVGVLWNPFKKRYNRILALSIFALALCFVSFHFLLNPDVTPETLIIRSTAFIALCLLHFILMIGPLCRLQPAFLPLLYNRRHLGVTMFFFAAIHGVFSIIQFHSLGNINPIASIFLSNEAYNSISDFPFQVLGFFALLILFLMAATSHDFWLKNLGPKTWKALHMLVYVAYALIILHIALGILQYESRPLYWSLLILGFASISGLHLSSGLKEWRHLRRQKYSLEQEGFFRVAELKDLEDNQGKGIWLEGENIAIFRYGDQISAVHNVCKHQQGPLSEGQVVEGCITCPWHGYQYLPGNGQSPPPFKEKLKTYAVKILDHAIWVNPKANPEGSSVEPAKIESHG